MWQSPCALLCAAALLTAGVRSDGGRLISIPDLHGDFERTVEILAAAQVLDPVTLSWIGGNTTVVQTGDITDRGDDGKKIYQLFFKLADEAPTVGGSVINLLGNHELMNIQNDLRYVSPGDFNAFGGEENRSQAWAPDGWLGKRVRRFPVAAKVGGVLFVHAGVSPQILDVGHGLEGVVKEMAHAIELDGNPRTTDDSSLLDDGGPVWTRFFSMPGSTQKICETADMVLERTGATRMVVGHTIQEEYHVHPICKANIILADTGISRAYGGEMSFIEHNVDGGAIAVYPRTGAKQQLVPLGEHGHLRLKSFRKEI